MELTATTPDQLNRAMAQVRTGTEDVQLQLTPYGMLTGLITDEEGRQAEVGFELILTHVGPKGEDLRSGSGGTPDGHPHGQFLVTFIEPGTYDLAVITADGRLGSQGAVLIVGGRPTQLKIRVAREGQIDLLYAGGMLAGSCRILKDGVVVQSPWLHRGHPTVVPVPFGRLSVEITEDGRQSWQEVVVTPGSVPDVMVP
jgi:hypothetical protein